ncbi:MAG TPA: methyltransferase domain-containing protein [Gemmatimonadaceae bacterium]|nr:methyltransferase domain-containing protein [Gemmatimonadaceae bacterium]
MSEHAGHREPGASRARKAMPESGRRSDSSPRSGESQLSPDSLLPELERRFVVQPLELSALGRELELIAPRSAEDLLNEEDFERDERLPYWADLWPSSYALADRVVSEDGRAGGSALRLLELGCGLGLVTIAALTAGFDVLATDYYADALLFTRANAWRVLGIDPEVRMVDWRDLPANLGRFDRVVAADVLYEQRYAAIVADTIARTLARSGMAIVADPRRTALPEFIRECEKRGLAVSSVESWRYAEGEVRQTILVHELIWSDAADERPRHDTGARLE